MLVLVCNAGSTSLKYKLYEMPCEKVLAESKIERVGSPDKGIFHFKNNMSGKKYFKDGIDVPNYESGIKLFLEYLTGSEYGAIDDISKVEAIGFKTVLSKDHYGIHELTDEVIAGMEDFLVVAPAHNKHYLEAVRTFKKILPEKKLIGVFETAFHTTLSQEAYTYSIPYEWTEKYGIRRMGYHGASHGYVSRTVKKEAGEKFSLISCHLGGSSSICAVKDGKSIDNSFGFSLQTGLPHSNRSGDIDPFIFNFLAEKANMTPQEIAEGLSKNAGLLGISGVSNDLREIEEAADLGNARARLAVNIFCRDIVKYIGAYYAILGGLDYISFTGGIGENSSTVRKNVCLALSHFGIDLDEEKNLSLKGAGVITKDSSRVKVLVIPANEELGIAQSIWDMLGK